MGRDYGRNDMRNRIAHLAARLMAEDGIEDYARAKRKAARQAGMPDTRQLPSNEEIDQALRVQQTLYHKAEHDASLRDLRVRALDAMREFAQFNPHLTGSVLSGNAGRFADIDLYLFTDNSKAVELFLLDHRIAYETHEVTRYSGDRARAVAVLALDWQGLPLKLSVFDLRDERLALKTTAAGRVSDRAGLAEVVSLVARLDDPAQT